MNSRKDWISKSPLADTRVCLLLPPGETGVDNDVSPTTGTAYSPSKLSRTLLASECEVPNFEASRWCVEAHLRLNAPEFVQL